MEEKMFRGVIFDMKGVIIKSEPQMQEKSQKYCPYPVDTKGYQEVYGIKNLIKSLFQNGIELAIASSSPESEICAVVERLGIAKYFTKLVSGETVQNPKPAPDIFEKALEEMELNSEECIVMEDSGDGIKAGVAAGMPVIGFYNPDSGNQDLSQAAMVVEGLEEVDYQFVKRVYQRVHKLPWRIVCTSRCIVRESIPEDYEAVSSIYNMEGKEYLDFVESYEQFCHYIVNRYPFYEYGMWTVLDKDSGMVIGRVGLEEREVEGEVYTELGYMIHYLYRRKGIGFEVCQAVLEYAKNILYIEQIYLFVHPQNTASKKLAEKLGFVKEESETGQGWERWRKLY